MNVYAQYRSRLKQKFDQLMSAATLILDKAKFEARELTPGEDAEIGSYHAHMQDLQKQINQMTQAIEMIGDTKFAASDDMISSGSTGISNNVAPLIRKQFGKALSAWGVSGKMDPNFATITTATQSGALLPQAIGIPTVPSYMNAFRAAIAAYGFTPMETPTTTAIKQPILQGSAGSKVAENASSETENAPTLDGLDLTLSTFQSGSAWFSGQVLNAPGFDLLEYITLVLQFSKELAFEADIAAGIIADAGVTNATTLATAQTLTYAELLGWNASLPRQYDMMKAMFVHSNVHLAMRKLVDSIGRPYVTRDPVTGIDYFDNTPVFRCDSFETFGDNKTLGALICVNPGAFRIRDAMHQNLHRYDQITAKPNQIGFNLIGYHAAGWADTAIAKLMDKNV